MVVSSKNSKNSIKNKKTKQKASIKEKRAHAINTSIDTADSLKVAEAVLEGLELLQNRWGKQKVCRIQTRKL